MRRRLLDAIILLVVAANGWSLAVCVCRYVAAHHHRPPLTADIRAML